MRKSNRKTIEAFPNPTGFWERPYQQVNTKEIRECMLNVRRDPMNLPAAYIPAITLVLREDQ
jgi:hypothetical protein